MPTHMNTPAPMRLCHTSELTEGAARGFDAASVFALRYRGRVHVWRDACPHYGSTPLAWRRDAYFDHGGTRVVCAAHGAQFEPDTGLCTLGPCLGQSLTRVPFTLTADGGVEIELSTEHDRQLTQDTST